MKVMCIWSSYLTVLYSLSFLLGLLMWDDKTPKGWEVRWTCRHRGSTRLLPSDNSAKDNHLLLDLGCQWKGKSWISKDLLYQTVAVSSLCDWKWYTGALNKHTTGGKKTELQHHKSPLLSWKILIKWTHPG